MSVVSIQPAQPGKTSVDFITQEGDPHPAQLIFALAGVGAALDRFEPTLGDSKDFELIGNLSVAAHVLSRMLATRID